MSSNVLDPMAQDISEQDIVMGEQELPPQMDPKPKMAAVCDTSPPHPHQNPPPIPAETARPSTLDMAQLFAMLAGISGDMQGMENRMTNKMKEETRQMKDEMREMRGEMRQVGQCLQAGTMATPRAATNELKGSAPAGEDRVRTG